MLNGLIGKQTINEKIKIVENIHEEIKSDLILFLWPQINKKQLIIKTRKLTNDKKERIQQILKLNDEEGIINQLIGEGIYNEAYIKICEI